MDRPTYYDAPAEERAWRAYIRRTLERVLREQEARCLDDADDRRALLDALCAALFAQGARETRMRTMGRDRE